MQTLRKMTLLALVLVPCCAWGSPEVIALFNGQAMVKLGEAQQLLKVGETSSFGVTLLAADTAQATLRYQNRTLTLKLSQRVNATFAKPARNEVRLTRDSFGQYRVRGAMNGHYVTFLVDTGASIVALSERQAQIMGLDYRAGKEGQVQTAQGLAKAYFVFLDDVTVGSITLRSVAASVIEGAYPTEVLLGMSFLGQVNYAEENGVLVLKARF
ncbi:MAG: TIGR02281 family clan AA aspartic protease [Pseudomonadota bacterium]